MKPVKELVKENDRRRKLYFREYSRALGDKAQEVIPRKQVLIEHKILALPMEMLDIPVVKALIKHGGKIESLLLKYKYEATKENKIEFLNSFHTARFKYDFEFWCFLTVKIQDKLTKQRIPFKLNRGQRRLVAKFEKMRLDGVPIRVILVKARQWGGSTVTQIYMLWLQLFHYENWHSVIISQLKTQAVNIRNMLSKTIKYYPREAGEFSFTAVSGTQSIRQIPERGCEVQIGSAEMPDAIRSFDVSMAHLSEIALWPETQAKSGDDLAQALYAAIPSHQPGTFICLESTAKGIGNFFHENWLLAESGESELAPVFVSWFEIDLYTKGINNIKRFIESMTPYNWWQWEQGATFEGINWYNWYKKSKRYSDFQMKSEFPTTAGEAFQTKSGKYFLPEYIEVSRKTCKQPIFIGTIRGDSQKGAGALRNIRLIEGDTGASEVLKIWQHPEISSDERILYRYLVTIDIGGKSYTSDNSVISVYDRIGLMDPFGALERVAIWVGHVDHDILAWLGAQIATYYDEALLVIESNTIDSRDKKKKDSITFEGDHFYTVIDELAEEYDNLYARGTPPDKVIDKGGEVKYGWHMNKKTKYQAYDRYSAAIRDGEYVERSHEAVNEMEWLEVDKNGGINAILGKRDDIQDTNAVGVYVAFEEMPLPVVVNIKKPTKTRGRRSHGAATI
ncbi:MAG: hypothetical protein BGO30_06015 [Bacteroidetes bacterium 41-46]|nr:MAG: hypothetical protein BGO30_06015 [Bacteroidetes bacterium 41-46]